MTKERAMEPDEDLVTYTMIMNGGEVRNVTFPAHWQVTFSKAVNPQERFNHGDGQCVRIYETKDRQRAVFVGVKEFVATSMIDINVTAVRLTAEATFDPSTGKKQSDATYEQVEVPYPYITPTDGRFQF